MGAYADTAYGDAYFLANKLSFQAIPWTSATNSDQNVALMQATQLIDLLNYAGDKHDESVTNQVPTQPNQFPRGTDTLVPSDIKDACCEIAIKLLDQVDPDFEIENLSLHVQGLGDARVARDTSAPQEHLRAGIPSIRAWYMLKPYLRDPNHAIVSRES